MFTGRYEHTIDEKGRISIPVKFREILREKYDERIVITTMDGCLYCYPYPEWEVLQKKASEFEVVRPEDKNFMRLFFSGAMEFVPDKLGRILLPQSYREYAGIKRDVIFAGMLKRIEIWSKEKFNDVVIRPSLEGEKATVYSEMASRLGI